MSNKTEISNMAISHLGVGKEIANVETERSEEALACRRFYSIAKDATLGDFNWSFATVNKALNLIETSPSNEWAYSYRYPNDALNVLRIMSGIRNETNNQRIPYKINKGSSGSVILTDQADCWIEYIERIEDETFFTPQFTMALSFRLAYLIAPRLTKGGSQAFKTNLWNAYIIEIKRAEMKSLNEEQRDPEPECEFLRSRS